MSKTKKKESKKFREIRDRIMECNEEALLANGFEAALIGYVEIFSKTIALYDKAKCLKILQRQGMSEDEASEFFEFNTQGAWMGEGTPAFATILRK